MYLVTLHMDGGQWANGAQMLAGTTANAGILVDSGHRGRQVVVGVGWNHLNSACRTVTGAVATFTLSLGRDAEVHGHHGVTNLYARLLNLVEGLDGASRANIRAACALRAAVASFERHHRLHQRKQVATGAEYAVGAFRHAQLTACALRCDVLQ